MSWLRAINEWLAVRIVLLLSTMGAVYLFTAWSLLPMVKPDWQAFVFYVSGGVLQLVLLPVIMVGQRVLSRDAESRAQQDHDAIMEEMGEVKQILAEIREVHRLLQEGKQ